MASYGAYPPPPPPPNQYPPPPPQSQPSQQRVLPANQYPSGQSYNNAHSMQNPPPAPPSSSFQHYGQYPSSFPPPPLPPPSPPPPPPPPDSSYPPPPPPPASSYYPSSQYSQFIHAPPPPPPPSSPPPSAPPPPPPSGKNPERRSHNNISSNRNQLQQQKPPLAAKKPNGGRVESEEERMSRKRKEMEKLRHEEKHKQQLKEHNSISNINAGQKNQALSSSKGGGHGHGSILGSRMGERRSAPILSSDRGENRLKKPTTFLCKMKFRNELPDPSAQPKLMAFPKDPERFTRYSITSLEKLHKPELYVEPDLGIPLDLLDLSVYNPPKEVPPLDPEDEELLRDDEEVTPIKKEGIRKKERPTDTGMSWLVKTQYISPLNNDAAKLSLTEKQAKELREKKGGKDILANFNSRERKIQSIEASFEAAKLRPVHQTKPNLEPVEILPLFPDFDRCNEQFVVATFDSAPTADSELSKLDMNIRREQESRAIMKSYVVQGSDPAKQEGEKFLAYMIPKPDELSKDILDPHEDVSYSWVREYHWDMRKEDADDPTTYLVSFDEDEARYLPLPTKLLLGKKKAREGKSDDAEQFPVPAGVTVRWRHTVSATEMKEVAGTSKGGYSNSKRRSDVENDMDEDHKLSPEMGDQYSGAEDDLSD